VQYGAGTGRNGQTGNAEDFFFFSLGGGGICKEIVIHYRNWIIQFMTKKKILNPEIGTRIRNAHCFGYIANALRDQIEPA
jgi:hypothetical protein